MITQERASTLVERSNTGHSFESIPYDVEFLAGIREAQAEIARGEFFTLEEVEKEIPS